MIVHILKMCTSYIVHVSYFFSFLTGVELRLFFSSEMLTVDYIAKLRFNLISLLFI